jgi:predicted nucleic-acid-binding Zn-ribbon protein
LSEFEKNVLSLLEMINKKLDTLLGVKPSPSVVMKQEEHYSGQSYVKPSIVIEQQKEAEKAIEKPPAEGRRVCPECGNTEFRTEEDKSQVLFQQGGMKIFAKKYICKKCGAEVY